MDEDVKEINKGLKYEDYWSKVDFLMDGTWKRFNILPSFAIALSVIFCSNSEVEKGFSVMNNIHQNKQRNCLSQQTLNATLHIRYGVESSLAQQNCEKCKTLSGPHCHCFLVDLSGGIRESCRIAWRIYHASLDEAKADRENKSQDFKKRNEAFVASNSSKLEKFKDSLSKRTTFF